jgi:uncharacterized protein (DUF305 family)
MTGGAALTIHGMRASESRIASLLLMALVAASASAQEHHGRAPAPGAGKVATPLYTPEDLGFLSHMIVHHEQALELAALVPSRTQREEFIRFARYVDGGQRAEIDQMKSLLRVASERAIEIPHHEMHGDPPMAGMLSKAQMAELAAAHDSEFERLWLHGMIYHHQGALDMAREQQQREFESGRQPYGIDVLVDDILVGQRAEITKMRTWLAQWGLSSSAETR